MASKFLKALGFGASLAAGLALAHDGFAKDWKTVVIGMEGAYEPWNLTDPSGKIVGFEPDLVMDLCKRAGFECKIIAQDWDGMIPGLKAGKFDVIMDGMSITDERKKEIDFSKPYSASPGAFWPRSTARSPKRPTRASSSISTRIPRLATPRSRRVQAALKGKTLGVQVSTTHANFAGQYFKDVATVKEYKTTDDRDLDLKSGRLDAVLDDYSDLAATASKPDAAELAVVGPEFIGGVFGAGAGMGIRKSDADLTAKFDTALAAAVADGTVKKLSEKWFKADMTPDQGAGARSCVERARFRGRRSGRSRDLRLWPGRLGPGAARGRADDAARLRLRPPRSARRSAASSPGRGSRESSSRAASGRPTRLCSAACRNCSSSISSILAPRRF